MYDEKKEPEIHGKQNYRRRKNIMARTRRVISAAEKLAAKQEEVTKLQAKLAKAEEELKDLEAKANEEKKAELFDIIEKSGKSLDEIKALLGVE